MPYRAPAICSFCNQPHTTGAKCERALQADRERKARFDAKRPTARQRGYTAEWTTAAKAFLAVYSSCRRCGRPATLVDHIEPHKGNQVLFWKRANWQPLCVPCHSSAKQSQERRDQKEK
jgi:5-methylcytosine-specific restriction endonuclease McrA